MSWPDIANGEYKARSIAVAEAQERATARLCASADRIADSLAQIQARTEAIFARSAVTAVLPQIPPELFRQTGNRRQIAEDKAAYRRACRAAEASTGAGASGKPGPLTDAEMLALGISIREELESQQRLEVKNGQA